MIRTYTELVTFDSFEDRFEYLKMSSQIGIDTFGFDRYLNQVFYKSPEWIHSRRKVIMRDEGCDLGILDRAICGKILIHHMNPITKEDVLSRNPDIFNPEYLICTSMITHNAIHYGDSDLLLTDPVERSINDTCPWRR